MLRMQGTLKVAKIKATGEQGALCTDSFGRYWVTVGTVIYCVSKSDIEVLGSCSILDNK